MEVKRKLDAGEMSFLLDTIAIEANGWTNVKVMEGGIKAWPYPRGK